MTPFTTFMPTTVALKSSSVGYSSLRSMKIEASVPSDTSTPSRYTLSMYQPS
ncbi:MAG: hypothetical protein A4E30_01265 [Methanomassiliicoccales archaeon PtaB.Bin215]|nr:MAG: hypothetical protein A4E30_01265 [Methanomassiliicoccales archaeon PtaB.Bin215]